MSRDNAIVINTLGCFYLEIGEDQLSFGGKINKTLELFLYLITFMNRPLPREELQEALWPEKSPDEAYKALNHNIHKLRDYLERNKVSFAESLITYAHGCYGINQSYNFNLDISRFYSHLFIADMEKAEGNICQAITHFKKMIELYRGDYLAELPYADWVIPTRHNYKRVYLKSIYNLVDLLKAEKRYQEILTLCEDVFFIEPLDEELHQLYIQALIDDGKKMQARAHYNYITEMLYKELQVKPSVGLQLLYKIICRDPGVHELSFRDIYEIIGAESDHNMPQSYDPYTFFMICKLERKRLVYGANKNMSLLSLTLTDDKFAPPSTEALSEAMPVLRRAIKNSLNSNHVFTRWGKTQYLILAFLDDMAQYNKIIDVITKNFQAENSNEKVLLRSSKFMFG